MIYLQPSEYEQYGLEQSAPAALVAAASSLIDAHCRRATLGVAQYAERVRLSLEDFERELELILDWGHRQIRRCQWRWRVYVRQSDGQPLCRQI